MEWKSAIRKNRFYSLLWKMDHLIISACILSELRDRLFTTVRRCVLLIIVRVGCQKESWIIYVIQYSYWHSAMYSERINWLTDQEKKGQSKVNWPIPITNLIISEFIFFSIHTILIIDQHQFNHQICLTNFIYFEQVWTLNICWTGLKVQLHCLKYQSSIDKIGD